MGKEVAAAVLTQVYFDKVHGAARELHPALGGGVSLESVHEIGKVYAAFLGQHKSFEVWAEQEFAPKRPK